MMSEKKGQRVREEETKSPRRRDKESEKKIQRVREEETMSPGRRDNESEKKRRESVRRVIFLSDRFSIGFATIKEVSK